MNVDNDVLHNENHSKLSDEEIAKAIAHHNRNHKSAKVGGAPAKKG